MRWRPLGSASRVRTAPAAPSPRAPPVPSLCPRSRHPHPSSLSSLRCRPRSCSFSPWASLQVLSLTPLSVSVFRALWSCRPSFALHHFLPSQPPVSPLLVFLVLGVPTVVNLSISMCLWLFLDVGTVSIIYYYILYYSTCIIIILYFSLLSLLFIIIIVVIFIILIRT